MHLDFCEIAICEDGNVRSAGRVASTPEALGVLAESLLATDRVLLEVTGSAWEIVRILEPYVAKVIVVSPGDTGITQARAKTDRLDARTLARLLWSGELDGVWVPDELTRVLRRRLSRREQLMRARTRAKNEIHAMLMRQLVGRPPSSDLFGVKGRGWLRQLELPVEECETVEGCMRQVEFLDAEIAEVERLIARYALSCSDARRLMSVPGVNVICAATFLAAIGDIRRFKTSRQLVGYLGLDPKVLHAFYERIHGRRGHGIAVVAAARKLTALFWCLLTREEAVRPPAAVADRQEAPAARADRRREALRHEGRPDLVDQPGDARSRTSTRAAGRGVLRADGPRLAGNRTEEQSGGERDTGARITVALEGQTSRGRLASS
ncbi:MAG TPA: IS110 family transposase [Solirubrobacteraceae bacterium]|nr:IS110 family transposase [Solirubrobacteraceae bacterium]